MYPVPMHEGFCLECFLGYCIVIAYIAIAQAIVNWLVPDGAPLRQEP